jgi:uncharacterized protein (DUF433 family)
MWPKSTYPVREDDAKRPGDGTMVALRKSPALKSEVVRDPTIMSGDPVIRGTRVPAMTIVAYLRAGRSSREIFEDYPTLPVDGIDAVIAWADEELGPDWRNSNAGLSSHP